MAFVRGYNPNEEADQNVGRTAQNPTIISESTGPSGASGGGIKVKGDPNAQKSTEQGGFANLQKYLAANRGGAEALGSGVADTIQSEADKARQGITSAGTQFGQEVEKGTLKFNPSLVGEAASDASGFLYNPDLQKQIAGQYEGPWDFNATDEATKTQQGIQKAQEKAAFAGDVGGRTQLLKETLATPGAARSSTTGMNLNQFLVQNTAPAFNKIRTAAEAAKPLAGEYEQKVGELGQQVEQAKTSSADVKRQAIERLGQGATAIQGQIEQTAGQKQEEANRNADIERYKQALNDPSNPLVAKLGLTADTLANFQAENRRLAEAGEPAVNLVDYLSPGQAAKIGTLDVASQKQLADLSALETLTGGEYDEFLKSGQAGFDPSLNYGGALGNLQSQKAAYELKQEQARQLKAWQEEQARQAEAARQAALAEQARQAEAARIAAEQAAAAEAARLAEEERLRQEALKNQPTTPVAGGGGAESPYNPGNYGPPTPPSYVYPSDGVGSNYGDGYYGGAGGGYTGEGPSNYGPPGTSGEYNDSGSPNSAWQNYLADANPNDFDMIGNLIGSAAGYMHPVLGWISKAAYQNYVQGLRDRDTTNVYGKNATNGSDQESDRVQFEREQQEQYAAEQRRLEEQQAQRQQEIAQENMRQQNEQAQRDRDAAAAEGVDDNYDPYDYQGGDGGGTGNTGEGIDYDYSNWNNTDQGLTGMGDGGAGSLPDIPNMPEVDWGNDNSAGYGFSNPGYDYYFDGGAGGFGGGYGDYGGFGDFGGDGYGGGGGSGWHRYDVMMAAKGGYIRGPGTGTSDSIPARLSNGEYVIPANAVNKAGPQYFDKLVQYLRKK